MNDPATDKLVVKGFGKFRGKIVEVRIVQNKARDVIQQDLSDACCQVVNDHDPGLGEQM